MSVGAPGRTLMIRLAEDESLNSPNECECKVPTLFTNTFTLLLAFGKKKLGIDRDCG
jgi:hypothetical protein